MANKANSATLQKAVIEGWKLGHRKDYGGKDPITVIKSRMPAVLTPDSVAAFVLSEVNKCLKGNKKRAEPYYNRAKQLAKQAGI